MAQAIRDADWFFRDEIQAAREWNLDAADASQISVPILLVLGADTRTVTHACEETIELLAALLPTAERVMLGGVGHGMPLENPSAVAALVADFVHRHNIH